MILTIPEEDNSLILTKKESKIKDSSLENGKYLLKCSYKNLYKEGDRLHQIFYFIQGKVLLYREDKYGNRHKLPQVNQGTFLGLNTLFDSSEVSHSATVIEKSLLLAVPVLQFKDLLNRWPNLKQQIIHQLINQLDFTEKKIS